MTGVLTRARIRVEGTVQGVGFRPFVYRIASEEGLGGYVLNDVSGVVLEVEGDHGAVQRFTDRLRGDAPPLAAIERVRSERLAPIGERSFRILESRRSGRADPAITPDSAVCAECLVEVRDPRNRRHRYPFINCTNCGPRFTIVRSVPYDRPRTTMAGFRMCPDCQREYDDPADRRFHAQPNACPRCGPRAWLHGVETSDPIRLLAQMLRDGAIAAVKGIGGFHLVCDARDTAAVRELRARKHREDKPFALMVADRAAAAAHIELDDRGIEALSSAARPIVIARRRRCGSVADAVAPDCSELGVMLPYTPLHHLVLDDFAGPLVMTSANVSDEPIAFENDDALERLAAIADVFLLHDRDIHTRADDSVLRGGTLIRRARGYVPGRLELPIAAPRPLLACGSRQKNTFAVARDSHVWVSQHIGDLAHHAALDAFQRGVVHFERLFRVAPEVIAHDLHPDYRSTAFAMEREGVELIGVQHHHAHLGACLAEHGIVTPAVAAIFDGTGYGLDGTVWGGELLVGDLVAFERVGRLWPVALPGGERAVREPWRMACSWLAAAVGESAAPTAALARLVDGRWWGSVMRLAGSGLNSPPTSSIGRLFDAVAALCGLRAAVTFEGQAAILLESRADASERGAYPLPLIRADGLLTLDARDTIRAVVADLAREVPVSRVAARFHNGLAASAAAACISIALERGIDVVVLSGGSFQNRLLLTEVGTHLRHAGLRVLVPKRLPPNDGGVSFGQAAIAAARMAA